MIIEIGGCIQVPGSNPGSVEAKGCPFRMDKVGQMKCPGGRNTARKMR